MGPRPRANKDVFLPPIMSFSQEEIIGWSVRHVCNLNGLTVHGSNAPDTFTPLTYVVMRYPRTYRGARPVISDSFYAISVPRPFRSRLFPFLLVCAAE